MGKRRERRKAAMSNTGRRVKLDLFAEPSGDLGGSSAKDEHEEGLDSKHSDGLPNSPSSSAGQQQENPLLLLGQYSDDDEDNELGRSHDHANGGTLASNIDKAEESLVNGSELLDVRMDTDQAENVDMEAVQDSSSLVDLQKVDNNDNNSKDTNISSDPAKEIVPGQQTHVSGSFDAQVVGDVTSGWKMVLHEETNQYYYWNMETGETSWEVPQVLAQMAEPCSNVLYAAADVLGGLPSVTPDVNADSTFIAGVGVDSLSEDNGSASGHLLSQSEAIGEFGAPGNGPNKGYMGSLPRNLPMVGDVSQQSEVGRLDIMVHRQHESGIDHGSRLIKLAEGLLQRLISIERNRHLFCDQDWISKCVLEAEIRLSDMKSLLSHGSALHSFWVYSEGQLRRLESVVDGKAGQLGKSTLDGDTKQTNLFFAIEDSGSLASVKDEYGAGHIRTEDPSTTKVARSSPRVDASTGAGAVAPPENVALIPNGSDAYSGEDIDMDVDMEVDDGASEDQTGSVDKLGEEILTFSRYPGRPEEPAEPHTVAPDDGSPIPPPPDEEWIPPPPPDTEQIPPPPPDEPEPSYPMPPPSEVGEPCPYTDQYSISYPSSSYGIYGDSLVMGSNFYGHGEGQIVLPHGPLLNTYAETASAINNADPVAYYVQDGTVPSVGVAGFGSTQYQIQSAPLSYSTLTSDQVGAGHNSSFFPHPSVEPSDGHGTTENGFSGITSTSATTTSSAIVEAPATTLEKDAAAEPSAVTAAAPATTLADAKLQSKAVRGKKRTVAVAPSFRSNKKVSSLVDKWKAAKEELEEEEEDEAKTALAMLEKKRQREIEEWHAQQIASGEAKENANFQPLGGDWRERVKRKRAQAIKEAAATILEESSSKGHQPPDLGEFSKDLPSGWQAYWDESSKQVYYGNALTSETTWIRPTK